MSTTDALIKEDFIGIAQCRYGTMLFFKNDSIVSRSLLNYGEWAQAEVNLLLDLIRENDVVVDVGAYIGTHTLAFSQKVGALGRVHAFEPNPASFELLRRNIKQNSLYNVSLYNAAILGDEGKGFSQILDYGKEGNFGGAALLDRPYSIDVGLFYDVTVTMIDKLSLSRCDLIKIDVEGRELEVVKGAQKTLDAFHPFVFAECGSLNSGWPVVEHFKCNGYDAYLSSERAFNDDNIRNCKENIFGDGRENSILFVHPSRKSEFFCEKICSKVIRIDSLDGLALGMLFKPQYSDEVLAHTQAAKVLGTEFIYPHRKISSDLLAYKAQLEEKAKVIESLEGQLEDKDQLVELAKTDLEEKAKVIESLEEQLEEKDQLVELAKTDLEEKAKVIESLEGQLEEEDQVVELAKTDLEEKAKVIESLEGQLEEKDAELLAITGSKAWYLAQCVRKVRRMLAPPRSSRERLALLSIRGVVTIHREGLLSACRKTVDRLFKVEEFREAWFRKAYIPLDVSSLPPSTIEIYNQNPQDAFRKIANIQIKDRTKHGVFTHPPAEITYRLMVPPRAIFRTYIALLPEVWGRNPGGVIFAVHIENENGRKCKIVRRVCNPSQLHTHRYWMELRTNMRKFANSGVSLRLIVSVPKGFSEEYAWAVWGNPVILSHKPFREVWSRGITYLRVHGIRSLLKQSTQTCPAVSLPDSQLSIQAPLPVPFLDQLFNEDTDTGTKWWEDYRALSSKITEIRNAGISDLNMERPEMILMTDEQLDAKAATLRFPSIDIPTVSIIIPVYNNVKLTISCLISVLNNTHGVSYEVIIIDDGSTDKSQELLSQIKNLTYIRNQENLGFLLSCNHAAEKARGELILFLNNDVQVMDNWLFPLAESLLEHPDVGAVGPKVIFPDGRLQEAGASVNRDASTNLVGVFDDPQLARYNYVREVDYCSGVCILVRAKVFQEIGGFDKRFAPAYCEDVDLCFELRRRGMKIVYNPKATIIHHLSATSNSIKSTYKVQLITCNQQKFQEKWQIQIDRLNDIRLIAFYLPQYHPIAENDLWWGKGFTEWANVVKARPNFQGHYQPHLPSELGFYDLRIEEVMEQQAQIAKDYGIFGFCFYYYWFNGKRLLDLPLDRLLQTGKPRIPFCLCWANENWTRKWDGRSDHILIGQQHSDFDDALVIKDLIRYMRSPNYIQINGKPLLLLYRIDSFPNIKKTVSIWRDMCRAQGVGEIYLAMVESFEHATKNENPLQYGFDASVEFPPHQMSVSIQPPGIVLNPNFSGVVNDYRELVLRYFNKENPGHVRFRTVMPSWDNTARNQNDPYVFAYASPGPYQAWLESMIKFTREQYFGDERIVFINAWNEWAEGAHLEPDRRFGRGFLEATRDASDFALLNK